MKQKKFGKLILLMKDGKPVTNINWNEAKELGEKHGLRLATFEESLELKDNKDFKKLDKKYFFWTGDILKNESPKEKYPHLKNRKDIWLSDYTSFNPVVRDWGSADRCVYASAVWGASYSDSVLSAIYVKLDESVKMEAEMRDLKDTLQITNHIRGHLDEIEYILEENGVDIGREKCKKD